MSKSIKGERKVLHGDCLELMSEIPDMSVDMILCDLPYGTTACSWDTIIPFDRLWAEYKRIIKDNGAIVLTASQPFTSALVMSNPSMFRCEWIWEKSTVTGHLNAKKMPMKAHEHVLVFSKKTSNYFPQKTLGHQRKVSLVKHKKGSKHTPNYRTYSDTSYDSTERYPRSVIKFATDKQRSALHPTQKPVALFEYLVKTYSKEGDLVLDNCAGSGTTGVACENTNRQYILIEKEQKYVDVINNRLKSHVHN